MESQNLQNFIEEAGNYLPMIRSAILVCSQEGNFGGELEISLRYAHAIKNTALLYDLSDISYAADVLGQEIFALAATRQFLSNEQTRNLLDKLAQLESLFAKIHFSDESFSDNMDGFVEESFGNLCLTADGGNGFGNLLADEFSSDSFEDFEGFEIDAEMLEIFGMEAEGLLDSIRSRLKILEAAPNDRDALLEIRRNAHTLKGSAGIVGLKPLSKLAHRVEDLLDFLSENEIESNQRIVELLSSSTDCLSALASGEDLAQLADQITQLEQNYNQILSALQSEKENRQGRKTEAEKNKLRARHQAAGQEQIPADDANKSKEENHPQKSVIRISLEKLDELSRVISDLIITRSVFEQRLAEFERQIGELQHSSERLKRSTAKLETDFEANALQVPSFKSQATSPIFNSSFISQSSQLEFDALEFDRYTEFHQTTRELLEATGDASGVSSELDNLRGNLELLFDSQYRLIEEMQDKLLRLRMIQFGTLAPRLHRTVSVTCEEENKLADLVIEGIQTEIDTQILNSLAEPLLHLLRNAIAHGIEAPDTRRLLGKPEKGRIHLRLHSEGTHIILTVTDDGRGISAAALKEKAVKNRFVTPEEAEQMTDDEAFSLIFLPGLTTAETIRQTAGRGVGMNIVKTSIARQKGTISVTSEPQKGATFTIRLPMALAVTRGLLVKAAGQIFAFPLKLVKQVSEISAQAFDNLGDKRHLTLDGAEYAFSSLDRLLGFNPASHSKKESVPLLLFENLETPFALTIDEILKAEEIVIKPLGSPLRNFPYLLGATILGDGRVVPVLDLIYLLKNQQQNQKTKSPARAGEKAALQTADEQIPKTEDPKPAATRVMIVDDSPSVRHITSKLVKNAGFEVVLAKDGLEALETLHAAENLPNVVLTDVEMPRMDGYELLAAVKNDANLQNIPVVMITSRASEKHHQKAIELGVSVYLTKPFDDAKLIEVINHLSQLGRAP